MKIDCKILRNKKKSNFDNFYHDDKRTTTKLIKLTTSIVSKFALVAAFYL